MYNLKKLIKRELIQCVKCTEHSVQCTVYSIQYTVYSTQYTVPTCVYSAAVVDRPVYLRVQGRRRGRSYSTAGRSPATETSGVDFFTRKFRVLTHSFNSESVNCPSRKKNVCKLKVFPSCFPYGKNIDFLTCSV